MGRSSKSPLSFHKAKMIHYKWIDGKFHYFGRVGQAKETFDVAYAEYLAWKRQHENPVKAVHPPGERRKDGFVITTVDIDPNLPDEVLTPENEPILVALGAMRTLLDEGKTRKEREAVYDAFTTELVGLLSNKPEGVTYAPKKRAQGMRLSEVLGFWQTVGEPKTQYCNDQSNRYKQFLAELGDIHLSELTADHIRQFIDSLTDKTPNNQAKILGAVKVVLNFCLKPKAQKSKEYDKVKESLPSDLPSLTRLLNVDTDDLTEPDDECTMPMPPKDFKAISAAIDRAGDKRFRAIWLLSCQCGLNLTDIGRLTWNRTLQIDADEPHLNLARLKRGKGKRVIALHPLTVEAVKAYRKTLPASKRVDGESAFYGIDVYHLIPPSPRAIRDEFKAYRDSAGVDERWDFRHVRNVGPNIRIKAGLPLDLGWAFLGHTNKLGEAARYEYQEPKRLRPLVNAIAADYFGALTPEAKPKKGGTLRSRKEKTAPKTPKGRTRKVDGDAAVAAFPTSYPKGK